MRNFGIDARKWNKRESIERTKNADAAIMTIAAIGTALVALSIYALTFGFGEGREVAGFLSFLH